MPTAYDMVLEIGWMASTYIHQDQLCQKQPIGVPQARVRKRSAVNRYASPR